MTRKEEDLYFIKWLDFQIKKLKEGNVELVIRALEELRDGRIEQTKGYPLDVNEEYTFNIEVKL